MDIVFITDRNQLVGMLAAMNSVIKNCCGERDLRFSIVSDVDSYPDIVHHINQLFGQTNIDMRVVAFHPPAFLQENIRVNRRGRLNNVLNYARFYLHQALPDLDKIIYLDADVIVQGNIAELWSIAKLDQKIIACVPSGIGSYDYIGTFYRNTAPLAHLDEHERFFNAGVYVTRLRAWEERGILPQIERWMILHKNDPKGLFELGTQPLLNLVFYRDYEYLPPEWNVIGPGDHGPAPLDKNLLETAKILHWKGSHKPWLPDGYFKDFWNPYDLLGVNRPLHNAASRSVEVNDAEA
jgi:lipopolysaccharide biosynthesis glycosyltransferase